ncbi:hypothetical protein SAMN06265337_1276 [Hymenobacter gelipurpurascens]|uniref:Lipoprotein n=1 Tax=Hymenobacter gelipurpurascens TaxID=89968 RepID=A0A212TH82_9BACT|nr:hypothetical protein [Hymenobacter gelipurpurascens]SNC65372.1 hypothetical protein SAMN06265337_1276 [Hymenobacter gelipurpurascens]
MKKLLIVLPIVLLSLAGCEKVDLTEGSPAELTARETTADARLKEAKHTVSVQGTFATLASPLPSAPGGAVVNGTGQMSHLGKSTFEDFPILDINALSGTGTRTITAANGDQLVGTLDIVLVPLTATTFTVQVNFTITGGTGRFTGATGNIYGTDVLDFNNPAGTASFVGEITY